MKLLILLLISVFVLNADFIGEVDFKMGELKVKNVKLKNWKELEEEDPVSVGDTLRTGKESKCEIVLNDGSIIRLNENTIYSIDAMKNEKSKVIFKGMLIKGQVWTNVDKKDKRERDFEVKTPVAVAAVIGTNYRLNYDGSMTEIAVMEGKVKADLVDEKKKELKIGKKKKSFGPKEVNAPKEIPGPFEVTLEEWIMIVKGDVIQIDKMGKYNRFRMKVEKLEDEWKQFLETKK